MKMRSFTLASLCLAWTVALTPGTAGAAPFFFSTGAPNGLIGTAARPDTGGTFEIESADDFVLAERTQINHISFFGLLVGGDLADVALPGAVLEMYRVFPKDSDVGRTSGPPLFSTPQVPTRVNSPSDVAVDDRVAADFSITLTSLGPFTVLNSVTPGGIHPK